MGKSSPTPPPAPDPTQLIQTQQQANTQSAVTQSALNNVQYQGPQGDVGYSLNPDTNQWTENVTLNPTEQATYSQNNSDQFQASQLAGQQLHAVDDALQQGLQAPNLQTGVATGNLATGYDSGGQIAYGFNPGGAIQSQVAPTYSPYSMLQGGTFSGATPQSAGASQPAGNPQSPPATSSAGGGSSTPSSSAALQALQAKTNQGPGLQQYLAQIQSGQAPSAALFQSDVKNPGALGQQYLKTLQQQPSAASPSAQPASQAGSATAMGNPYGSSAAPSQANPYAAIASNPVASTQLATYQQAAQMLNPQWSQASEQQQAQLAAQGLNPNDAAYQNAMQIFGNQENQAYNQAIYGAINAGDAEQNTLYGQNLSSGQFANQAQAQQYSENQGQAQFNNTAQAQANGQNAAAAAFNNQAQGQNWQEQYSNAQLANQAAQQQFQDQAYSQELPVNEFTALMNGSQVAMPTSSPAQNTQVQVPNVNNAYQLQQNGQQFAYNANEANSQSSLGGLLNLGNSILGLTGL